MYSEPIKAKKFTHYLTGMRGIAALLIMAEHAIRYYMHNYYNGLSESMAVAGMSLFFVLSGFVLTLNYSHSFDAGQRAVGIYNFFIARLARLGPLYYVIIIIVLWSETSIRDQWLSILSYFTMTQSWFHKEDLMFHVSWSISTEVFSYVFFPLIIILLSAAKSTKSLLLSYLGVIAGGIGITYLFYVYGSFLLYNFPKFAGDDAETDISWIRFYNPYIRLFDFMAGCVAARLYLHPTAFARLSKPVAYSFLYTAMGGIIFLLIYKAHHIGEPM